MKCSFCRKAAELSSVCCFPGSVCFVAQFSVCIRQSLTSFQLIARLTFSKAARGQDFMGLCHQPELSQSSVCEQMGLEIQSDLQTAGAMEII